MDKFTRDDLLGLMEQKNEHSISIYMPTIRVGTEVLQNPIRLKNLIDQVKTRLSQGKVSPGDIRDLVEPLNELANDLNFWTGMSDGLAIFRADDYFRTFQVPIGFDEIAYLNTRFYAKPLVPLLEGDGKFLLLALSMNNVRLYVGDKNGMSEIDLGDTPTSMVDALGYDNIQSMIRNHVSRQGNAMFYGEGASNNDSKKEDILRFFQILEKGLDKRIAARTEPLILAGVEYLIPIYREANSYPHLYDEYLTGNPEDMRVDELHEDAWELVAPFYQQSKNGIVDGYHILANQDQASKDIQEIVPAAFFGQVDTLIVPNGVRIWGTFDPETYSVAIHDHQNLKDDDLIDLAMVFTLRNGGTIYTFDSANMPDGARVAATLRYPLKGLQYSKTT